jgi:dUTP pyrophosphatase
MPRSSPQFAADPIASGAGIVVRFRRLHEAALLPEYQSAQAAGMDLCACLPDGPLSLAPGDIALIPTGLAGAMPEGHEGQIRPRSGLATRHGITMPNAPGTIDQDYRGELKVALINFGRAPFVVEHGMRIAQLVIAPVARPRVVEVASLDATDRGERGFGSTGL